MTFATKPLVSFLDELASGEPVPGGGSVAALSGALGASLISMVCRLTIGKKGYEAVFEEMRGIQERAITLQRELLELLQADSDAYRQVMGAYQLPSATDTDKATRLCAIQDALKGASDVPLHVAELCLEVLELARPATARGNKNAASDGGVGALMAEAGLRGAAFNVTINLSAIRDRAFADDRRARAAKLVAVAERVKHEILETVEGRL